MMYIQWICGLVAFICVNIYAEMPGRMRLSYRKDRARKKRAARAQKKVCMIHDVR